MHLYIHVPFCRSKCLYCGFASSLYEPALLSDYVSAVCEEIRLWGRLFRKPRLSTIYFGGGTPSLLPLWALEAILRSVREHCFVSADGECSLEANPESCRSLEYLKQLLGLGVNRLSVGLQSLNNDNLGFLGRVHTAEQGREACVLARDAGFANLSVDLLWSIPGQDTTGRLDELEAVQDFGISHISSYALTVEPGTGLEARDRANKITWPSEDEQARMYLLGIERLQALGFKQYEISNFARPGLECRHNIGYWQGRDYLGVGPAAVSCVASRRWSNPENILDYLQGPLSGDRFFKTPVLDKQDRINEWIMLGLRTCQGLSLTSYIDLTGTDLLHEHQDLITELQGNDLICVDQNRLCLTPEGMLVSDSVIARFFH